MAILTYPLNGILYDAEDAEIYNCTRTSGVFASDGHFPASITGTREVSIGPGLAWMQNEEFHGKAVYNPETVALAIAEADAYQARIDRIVLRFDKLANQTTLVVLQGTPSSSPVAPDITRDSYTYELGLYTVNVKASSISVSASDIGSTMLDDSVCGIMADAVTNIPTQQLYDQWYAWFSDLQVDTETLEEQFNIWFEQIKEQSEQYMTDIQYEFQVWMNGEKVSFDEWFDTVQDTLDSDTAGKLTNLVNDAQDSADEALEQLATGIVRGFMTDEAEGGEYALLADDSDETHAITLMRNICDCGDNETRSMELISDEFQESHRYSAGDYCIYQNTLYVFTADKSAGAWDWSCVKATNVGTELSNTVSEAEVESLSDEIDSLSSAVDSIPAFDSGIENSQETVAGGSYRDVSITFSTSFSGTPVVVAGLSRNATGNGYGLCAVNAFNRSSTGFTLRYINGSDYNLTPSATWIAIGTKSATISPQGMPDDDDDDSKVAPGPEIIDPDDDTGGDEPDNDDDDTKTAPGPEIVEPDDDDSGNDNPDNENPDDDEPDDDDEPVIGPGPEEVE